MLMLMTLLVTDAVLSFWGVASIAAVAPTSTVSTTRTTTPISSTSQSSSQSLVTTTEEDPVSSSCDDGLVLIIMLAVLGGVKYGIAVVPTYSPTESLSVLRSWFNTLLTDRNRTVAMLGRVLE
eukprot:5610557-Amphidinium_carterae.1